MQGLWLLWGVLGLAMGGEVHLPQEGMKPVELIQYNGFMAEEYEVTTKDGYILTVQRIPKAAHGPLAGKAGATPVLLMHGLGGSACNYLTNRWDESLAYVMADAGFDVWLGNVRGNLYSRGHTWPLSSKDYEYWHFSWQQMAEQDLPSTVDFVLEKTGYKQLYYVGHSQGTLMGFAQFSEDLEFAKKIKMFFALAPVADVGHITAPIGKIAPYVNVIYAVLDELLGIDQMGDLTWIQTYITRYKCYSTDPKEEALCNNVLVNNWGPNYGQLMNKTNIPVFLSHNPAGESIQDVVHFGQMVNSKKMQKFDYGYIQNMLNYGKPSPPVYDVGRMEVESVLFWSQNDTYADPIDVHNLIPKLRNSKNIQVPQFSHFDFIWALDATELVYKPIIETIKAKEAAAPLRPASASALLNAISP